MLTNEPNQENTTKQNTPETGLLVWSGIKKNNLDVDFSRIYSFEKAIERIQNEELDHLGFKNSFEPIQTFFIQKTLNPKDEFETEAEFQRRKAKFELSENARKKIYETKKKLSIENYKQDKEDKLAEISNKIESLKNDILNSYLGEQKIEMKYNADSEKFDVSVDSRILKFYFQIKIPRIIAREFKSNVKNFNFICLYRVRMEQLKYNLKIGIQKVKIDERDVQVGTKKIKVATKRIFGIGDIFYIDRDIYDDEPVFEKKPIYEEQPVYKEQIKEEKKVDFKIIKARVKFLNQVFESTLNIDIHLEELKKEIKNQYKDEFV